MVAPSGKARPGRDAWLRRHPERPSGLPSEGPCSPPPSFGPRAASSCYHIPAAEGLHRPPPRPPPPSPPACPPASPRAPAPSPRHLPSRLCFVINQRRVLQPPAFYTEPGICAGQTCCLRRGAFSFQKCIYCALKQSGRSSPLTEAQRQHCRSGIPGKCHVTHLPLPGKGPQQGEASPRGTRARGTCSTKYSGDTEGSTDRRRSVG